MKPWAIICFSIFSFEVMGEEPDLYFPKPDGDQKGWGGIVAAQGPYFSECLRRMNEPSLLTLSETEGAEAYRFTYFVSRHPNVRWAVRMTKTKSGFVIYWNRLEKDEAVSGRAFDFGKLAESKSQEISEKLVDEFKELVKDSKILSMPIEDNVMGFSGDYWLFEAVSDGKYNLVVRWTPDAKTPESRGTAKFMNVCEWLAAHAPTNFDADEAVKQNAEQRAAGDP